MSITRVAAATLLALAVLSSTTGCVQSPFQQDVPATQWTTDENGNTTKVKQHASEEESAPEQVRKVTEAYYSITFDQEKQAPILALEKKVGKNVKREGEDAVKLDNPKELDKLLEPDMESLSEFTKYMDNENVGNSGVFAIIYSNHLVTKILPSDTKMTVKVPMDSIAIDGDSAIVEGIKLHYFVNGEETDLITGEADDYSKVFLIKRDEAWLVDSEKTLEYMGKKYEELQKST